MNKPIGGRGCVVPYVTKLTRIPAPLDSQVGELKSRYYGFVDAGGNPDKPVNWIIEGESLACGGADETLKAVAEIVHQWECKLDGKDLKTAVRYTQAAKLLNELREALYLRGGK